MDDFNEDDIRDESWRNYEDDFADDDDFMDEIDEWDEWEEYDDEELYSPNDDDGYFEQNWN